MRKALLGLLLLVLGGCGGGGTSAAPDVGELAAAVTAQTASRRSAHVTFETAAGTRGQGDYRVAPDLAAELSMTSAVGATRFILLDKVIYLRLPQNDRTPRPWTRFAAGGAQLADALIDQADIGRQLEKIRSAGTITGSATEHLDGRPTTRYTIDVTVARLIEAERDDVVRESLRELAKRGTTTIPYRLWLDGENLPVRIAVDLPGRSSTTNYTRWGEPVAVAAPPAAQVSDAPQRG
jgi:hypothetical protein